jgi:hypothetical protein
VFIDQDRPVVMTWNPYGKVRLGVRSDPDRLETLREVCAVVETLPSPEETLAHPWADTVVEWVANPLALPTPLEPFYSLQTLSRGALLRRVGEVIAEAVAAEQITPGEIAIVGPGLDTIARYTLEEILLGHGIPVASLNDQRPLIHSPLVRALLTLITFVYPNLGHLADADAVAEMLVVPACAAVTSPAALMVATALLAELQVNVALLTTFPRLSVRVALSCTVAPEGSELTPPEALTATTGGTSGAAGSPLQAASRTRLARTTHE